MEEKETIVSVQSSKVSIYSKILLKSLEVWKYPATIFKGKVEPSV